MTRWIAIGVLVFAADGVSALQHAPGAHFFQTPAATRQITSRITVTVPHDQAVVVVDGRTLPGTGTSREFHTPPLETGAAHQYRFTVTWRPNTYTEITRTKTVSFRAGDRVVVDLTVDDPTDRARVRYVPTPEDIAAEMIKLAGVKADDVVYEPGCGDARITIAAVRAGARRGVGIDIDPERVTESRANVKAADLEDRIEIRLGDALDIQDLSAATVVFLYMGNEFNALIRPILWKQLEVGSRVVSHRFTMGDWKPDETVSVTGLEDGEYDLHLWTITEEIKRKVDRRDMMSPAKVAVVTGSGSGIGKAVALGLLEAGYAVVLAGRRADRLAATIKGHGFSSPRRVVAKKGRQPPQETISNG